MEGFLLSCGNLPRIQASKRRLAGRNCDHMSVIFSKLIMSDFRLSLAITIISRGWLKDPIPDSPLESPGQAPSTTRHFPSSSHLGRPARSYELTARSCGVKVAASAQTTPSVSGLACSTVIHGSHHLSPVESVDLSPEPTGG